MGNRKQHKRRTPIRKAAPSASGGTTAPNAKPPDDDSDAALYYELRNMRLPFLSLVPGGANRQTQFMVVKADDENGDEHGSSKAVPSQDATSDAKHQAQVARSKQYGIEVKNAGSALSYPAGAPTVESLYGDPVNLSYPFGGPTNSIDLGRVRNALARFKQNANQYKLETSRARVYERIVRRALAAGIDVSYDANDPVDRLLPGDLKQRLNKHTEQPDGDPGPGTRAGEQIVADRARACQRKADTDAWLVSMMTKLAEIRVAAAAAVPSGAFPAAHPERPPASIASVAPLSHVGTGVAPPTDPSSAAGAGAPAGDDALRKSIEKARAQASEIVRLRKENRALRQKRLRIGHSSAIVAGDAFLAPPPVRAPREDDVPMGNGINLSEHIRNQEKEIG